VGADYADLGRRQPDNRTAGVAGQRCFHPAGDESVGSDVNPLSGDGRLSGRGPLWHPKRVKLEVAPTKGSGYADKSKGFCRVIYGRRPRP